MQISAKVIAHSISPTGRQIASLETCFNRFILPEVNTHKICSLSASSSRAIPTAKLLEQVREAPAPFINWRMNQSGMQPAGEAPPEIADRATEIHESYARMAADHAQQLAELGIAKEQSNRYVEPVTWTRQIMTSTSFANLLALRDHADAQKEFQVLARLIREALENSTPTPLKFGEWHTPYVSREEYHDIGYEAALKASAARSARVSFLNHDRSSPVLAKDFQLFEGLCLSNPAHMSPAAHQGTPTQDPDHRSRNFQGFVQFREVLEQMGFSGYEPSGVVDGFI